MKKYILNYTNRVLFTSLLFLCFFSYAQVKVIYEVKYKPDSTIEKYNIEEMTLEHFEDKSYFYNETKFKLDSIYDSVTTEYLKTGQIPKISLKYELNFGIYKNLSKQELYEIQNVSSRNFFYKSDFEKLNWKITNEKKQILKYSCTKAIVIFGGRIWEAWFSKDIPIPDGPYKFFGLPGLILEIYDTGNNYHFSTVSVIKKSEKIKLPTSLIKTTQINYLKIKNKLIRDPSLFVRESIMRNNDVQIKATDGNPLQISELYQRIDKEFNYFIQTHNNHIEKNKIWIR
ncbi:GLPGLI family protein [Epilithonimonas hispanica]|uniref:GLPGLI family protein n=1 Tax=Epilithonimonas hispanica TaxID=358687 RepID=UPI0013004528|nr:GLPGLI family protein [Epilithonimonas hispanica]